MIFVSYAYHGRHSKAGPPPWYAVLHPFSVCVFIHAAIRSVFTTLASGDIEWRGTKYPLEQLKRNTV
jgi:hypothetical protein